jgi:hypothetical protein
MSAVAQNSLTGSSRRKEALTLCLSFVAAVVNVSCAGDPATTDRKSSREPAPIAATGILRLEENGQPKTQRYALENGDNLDSVLSTAFEGFLGGAVTRGRNDLWVTLIRETNGITNRTDYTYGLMSKTERQAVKLKDGDILDFESLVRY